MANVQKYNRGAVGNMTKHYERGINSDGEKVKFSNQDIDTDLSHLNYNLAPERKISQVEYINQRTSEVKCLNRKDVNVMCSWVVTAPKDLPGEKHNEFFKEAYKFLNERYQEHGGEKNVISAHVHMDENQPHLHYAFVPVTKDKKKGHLKVSAKEVINRIDLKSFHTDLSKHMERHFGRDIGILNEATIDGNKSIQELKRKSAAERLNSTKEQANKILSESSSRAKKILSEAKLEVSDMENKMYSLRSEYKTKKAYIDKAKEISEVSMMYPTWVEKKEKGIFNKKEVVTVPADKWEAKHISANEIKAVIEQRDTLEKEILKFQDSLGNKSLKELKKEIDTLHENYLKIEEKYKIEHSKVQRIERYWKANPEKIKEFKKYEEKQADYQEFKSMMNKKARYDMNFINKAYNSFNKKTVQALKENGFSKKDTTNLFEKLKKISKNTNGSIAQKINSIKNKDDIIIFTKKDREILSKTIGKEIVFKDFYKFKNKQLKKAVVNSIFSKNFNPKSHKDIRNVVAKYRDLTSMEQEQINDLGIEI